MVGRTPDFSAPGGAPLGSKGIEPGLKRRICTEFLGKGSVRSAPHPRYRRGYGVPPLGDFCGRFQHLFQGKASEAAHRLRPGRRRAGHVYRNPAALRHGLVTQRPHFSGGSSQRSRSAAIEPIELSTGKDQGESVRADSVGGGLYHRHAGSGCNCCVNGVAARLQDVQSRLRGQRLGTAHHAAGGIGYLAPGREAIRVCVIG